MQQPNQIVTGKTHADLGTGFAAVQGRGIYITFQWDMVKLDTIDPEKNGKRIRRLRLMKQPIGDPNTSSSSYITEDKAQELYPAEWEYFTKHGDMPVSGTALSELPGISNSQIQIMQLCGLRSIEDVLSVGEEVIGRIGHEGRFVRSVAEEWKKRSTDGADVIDYAEMKAASDAALTAQKSRADRAEAANTQLTARLEALEQMMNAGGGGGTQAMQPVGPTVAHDEGPDIDSTHNPLADGDGGMDDDPLQD